MVKRAPFVSLSLLLLVSVMLVGCGGTLGTPAPSVSNADLLKTAASNMKNARGYHIDLSGSTGGSSLTMSGDIDRANNKSKLNISTAGTSIATIIVSGNTYASTDGGKTYIKGSANVTGAVAGFTTIWDSFNPQDVDKAAASLKDGSPPTDTINGASCKHITASARDLASLSSASINSMDGTVDIWVATDGSSVCQLHVASSAPQQGDVTIKWSNLNGNFDIQAPAGS